MSDSVIDTAVDEYFARQYGVITLAQAEGAGFSHRMVQRRIESGRWRQLAQGTYAVSSAPRTWRQRLAAALLYHPRAVVTGNSAARLHRFNRPRLDRPEVMVPRTSNARSPLGRVERSAFYFQTRTVRVDGFEVISPAETVLKLAALLPSPQMEVMVDQTLIARSATLGEYLAILDRIAGGRVRGSAALRQVIDERRPEAYQPPTSELERLSRRLTDRPDLPPVTHQHPVLGSAGQMIVDTFIDGWLMVVEVDGRNYHTRKADFERDRRRDNAAAALGYVTLRFTWKMLTTDFEYCLRTLLETGRQRENLGRPD